ncbi:cytochrome c biogenesis protein CcmG/thiol:disulfide interchange protein DsbE [Rhizobium sp. BK529]|uniref:DsbE family thiol:disulfide interchange protein n=1 Tax=unclassified Rhizobium TaxID=2613769 RepID=UPI0010DAA66E|nr:MULTISPECIES: DsbE family thiol:disulfide interchange protein [unclassified Rhizobium]MBB3593725.1 cytochrome c biogenesis protein CcmG/thiol:disulfide interchange protein DsbE [Rhizobium sp. BK529]TCR94635.1 cytochrome c biogenesis protein CcmG/thiol:disulfide interchange protein DsbE [Rhizobium sp. BK418]
MRRYMLAAVPLLVFATIAGAAGRILYREAAEGYSPSTLPSALIGQAHPAIDLPPLAGLHSPGFRNGSLSGQVAIVNVFASWCIPCRQEHAALMRLSKDRRIKLMGINYKDDSSNALVFLRDNGNPYAAVGVDPTGREAIDWGVYGVPETFAIGRDGRILFKHVGPLDDKALSAGIGLVLEKALAAGG